MTSYDVTCSFTREKGSADSAVCHSHMHLTREKSEVRAYGTPSVTKINSAIGRHKVRENVMHARRAVIVTRRAVTLQDVL